MDSIGAIIHGRRKALGLTLDELSMRAYGAGGRKGHLSRIEHGKSSPSWETLERIARGLDFCGALQMIDERSHDQL